MSARRSGGRVTFNSAVAGVVLVVGTSVGCGSSSDDSASDVAVATTDEDS